MMMKQPELGRKILELRQQKGLTQEELVEQCNISVRTIQRIEAGEVTPRSYTIRTILDALDYDLSQLQTPPSATEQRVKEWLLLDVNTKKEASFLIQQLNLAWISAIIYFFITIPDILADVYLYEEGSMLYGKSLYIVIKLLVIASYIFYFRGLILTGRLFQNYMLKIMAFMMLFAGVVFYSYDLLALAIPTLDYGVGFIAENISFGIMGILFGISLLRLNAPLEILGKVSGVLELTAALCFLFTLPLLFMGVMGLFLWSVAILVEVILLYKVADLIKQKEKNLI